MHTFLYCVLLPFVGPVLNSVGAPKLDMTSFLTNDSGLGFASSNREKIPVIPSVRYLGAISMQSGFQLLLGFALVNSFGAPKLATTAFFSYESGLGFFPPNLKRIPIKSSPRYLGAISMQSRFKLVLGLALLQPVTATCPYCFGNIPSCTFGAASGAACPADVVPRENAAIITGSATGALKLAGCLAPRFLRMLSRAELTTITTLANRPPPGTSITFTAATKLKDLVVYMKQGLISREQIEVTFAEFIDAEADATKKKDLRENVKFLMSAGEDAGSDEDPGGLYTWLLGMVVSFVLTGTVVTTSALSSGSSPGTSSTSTSMHKTKVQRPKSLLQLMEILNLYVMFFVSLGLGPAGLITSFFQCVIFDTIVVRKYEWCIAFELMVVLFRKIENSVGNKFNLGNVIDEVHLNSALEEASEAAKMFFRTGGGAPRLGDRESLLDINKKQFNGKFNKDEKCRACAVFNSGGDHKPHMLTDDGTCRFGHKCDHWVSDQGPGGICRNKAGKPGHNRRNCDNPNKCDSKLQ